MEQFPNSFESPESPIDRLIDELAEREEMSADDILSDIMTFVELSETDEDAAAYLEEVAEKLGISLEDLKKYAEEISE